MVFPWSSWSSESLIKSPHCFFLVFPIFFRSSQFYCGLPVLFKSSWGLLCLTLFWRFSLTSARLPLKQKSSWVIALYICHPGFRCTRKCLVADPSGLPPKHCAEFEFHLPLRSVAASPSSSPVEEDRRVCWRGGWLTDGVGSERDGVYCTRHC